MNIKSPHHRVSDTNKGIDDLGLESEASRESSVLAELRFDDIQDKLARVELRAVGREHDGSNLFTE